MELRSFLLNLKTCDCLLLDGWLGETHYHPHLPCSCALRFFGWVSFGLFFWCTVRFGGIIIFIFPCRWPCLGDSCLFVALSFSVFMFMLAAGGFAVVSTSTSGIVCYGVGLVGCGSDRTADGSAPCGRGCGLEMPAPIRRGRTVALFGDCGLRVLEPSAYHAAMDRFADEILLERWCYTRSDSRCLTSQESGFTCSKNGERAKHFVAIVVGDSI